MVEFWRQKSGWNNIAKMSQILKRIKEALAEFEGLQGIILLDCASCHIHPQVAAAAEECGLWLAVVPARLTFLVQPLDVYALSPYKACLAKAFAEAEDDNGNLETVSWMNCLGAMVRKFWCARKWLPAFEKTGMLPRAEALTVELQHLQIDRISLSPLPPPEPEDVEASFPKGRRVPYVSLFWLPAGLDPPLLT